MPYVTEKVILVSVNGSDSDTFGHKCGTWVIFGHIHGTD